jgi:MYXO-CTERM domain-containing protein
VTPTKPPAFAGKQTPICAVYMSANQSGQPVPPEVIPVPGIDLNFPDLTLQPWYQGSGNSIAVEFADSLIDNGYWDIPNTGTPDPLDTTRLNWEDDGLKMLVNEKIGNNKNQSNFSPYFLWDIDVKPRKVSLKSEVVYYNERSNRWENSAENTLDADTKYWYWVLDAPGTEVPGPLPLLGAGAAFGWSRRLRQRVRQASSG